MNNHLATYLNDHLAGATVALELLEHLEKSATAADLKSFLTELRADITADRKQLEALMERHRIAASTTRQVTAWLTEKMTQVKLRLDDPAGGALRLLEAIEVLSIGIEGKRLLWRALAAASVPAGPDADYQHLEQRAQEQRQRVETVRLGAARAALVGS